MNKVSRVSLPNFKVLVSLVALSLMLLGCEQDNEHFCVRYQYLYNQLLEPDLPSYDEMRLQLMKQLADPKKDKDQAKFMLFVLDDWRSGVKTDYESPQQFCMRIKRWESYH